MRPLGLTITPSKVGPLLCRDVLMRMKRADDHPAQHAAAALTGAVLKDLQTNVVMQEGSSPLVRDPATHWSPALARVALWASGFSSVRDARLWLWASGQPWFRPSSVTDQHVAAVIAAASKVIEISPTFNFSNDRNDAPADSINAYKPPGDARAEESDTSLDFWPEPSAPADDSGEAGIVASATAQQSGVVGDEEGHAMTASIQDDHIDVLRQASDNLRQALLQAVPVAQRILDRVTADRPPAADDLSVITTARTSFDDAVARLQAAGTTQAPETGEGVRAALNELITAADDAPERAKLARLRDIHAPAGNAMLMTALAEAQRRADVLAASSAWTPAERSSAIALAMLHELSDPGTAAPQVVALQQQFVQTHPDLALLAITAAQLTRSPAANTQAVTMEKPKALADDGAGAKAVERATGDDEASSAVDSTSVPTYPESSELPYIEPSTASSDVHPMPEPSTAEAADQKPATVSDEVIAHAHLVQSIADLIRTQRFGLAAAVAQAGQWTTSRQAMLRIAALSDAVRSETGTVNAALRGELTTLDRAAASADSPSALIIVASLVRAALATGEPTTGAVLTELAARVEPNLAAVAEQVGGRALKGLLIGAPPLTALADVSEVEQSARAASDTARKMLRPRTIRFKRATDVAKAWMASDGLLGRPLTIAANNQHSAVHEVTNAIQRLGDPAHIAREIDALDRELRGTSGKPLQGAGRQNLVNLAQEAMQTLVGWAEAVLALQRSGTAQEWMTGDVADMRAAVLARRQAVLAALAAQAQHTDPLLAAASRAAASSLEVTFSVLAGEAAFPAGEPTATFVLTAELLKVPGAVVDATLSRVTVPAGTTVEQLLAVVHHTWTDAVLMHVAAENFDAADFLLTAATSNLLPGAFEHNISDDAAVAAATAQAEVRKQLEDLHEQLSAELRRAQINNEVSEEQAGELTGLLQDADVSLTRNYGAIRVKLAGVAERLPLYRAEAARRLSDRLVVLPDVDEDTIKRVQRLIADGELSTAEELIYFLEIGEPVPQVSEQHDLQQFLPAVPDALRAGLTKQIIETARSRSRVPGCEVLDFSRLSPDLAELAAAALEDWRQLATTPPERRGSITERELLLPALRIAGIEGKRTRRLDELPRGRDRRFIDVVDVTINGKAPTPAFGSRLGGRLRVLLAWGQPSAQLLLSHADQDNSGESLLIAYFGTMNMQTRRELAQHVVADDRTAPVVVLDDAALVYLAAHGNRQIDATMSVLLPFSNINPYARKKRGLVAEEMFYGRDAERKSVIDSDGTQLLYGGRGLGKSALLRNAGQKFESQGAAGERVSLYLSLDTVGIRPGSAVGPDAIWDALLRDFTEQKIISPRRQASRKNSREQGHVDRHKQVRASLLTWLDADPRRRMLILLDEADRFFESDAPEFFETNRLKDLGLATDGRIKVVFAGLHSVQRYAKSARNGPFSHLAQRPTVIGPLRPQFATNLLVRPLQALGYGFDYDDLVNRILGYCSYQPFLLQMFGSRLLAQMHTRRSAGIAEAEPPYIVKRADVVAVESHVDLRADISTAFHDTLHLDPRYNVIANVLAHHAHEFGLDARLSDVQLREECLAWWHVGFAALDVEAFRAYLQEMVGLGVLAPNNDGRGWHLRSPNVLRMIGSNEDVVTQLVGAETLSVPDEFIALETRAALPNGRRSPLTAGQADDVLGDHANQVRIVLGSPATGIGDVESAVRLTADVGDRFTVPSIANRRQFEEELVNGRPGERRVVLTDLAALEPRHDACNAALQAALELRPQQSGVTRSTVLIAGPQQMRLWRMVLGDDGRTPALGTVVLRRYTRQTLHVWALDSEKFTVLERRERLLQVTGGWPLLVEKAGQLVASGMEEGQALLALAEELQSRAGAAALVDAVGIAADEQLVTAFNTVLALVDTDGVSMEDLVAAVTLAGDVDDPDIAVAVLQALGTFDIGADSMYRPESLLARSWRLLAS
ncbi:AAA domain-containing protein [Nonomuraea solani]|uniref:AAA domain-containing protein n=2 Tax=Nonomuraea solani TaxID=1144553 RepID=A0A1H6F3V1_9ACTN|nr:AAA domain-containing protein [Nonomuraea solani]